MSLARAVVPAPAPADPMPAAGLLPDRAVRLALDLVSGMPALPVRSAPLASCHDRVLAERVRADADIPARDCATVDGYAFSGDACRGDGPWRLRLTGRIAVARNLAAENPFPSREAVRISADGVLPPQLDRVVPADAVTREGDIVILRQQPDPNAAIQRRGAGAQCGEALAEPDRLLDPRDIAVLASAGYTSAKLRRALRVAVLSMGHGKQETGSTSRAMLMAALDRRWITRQDMGAVSGGALAQTLRKAAEDTDVLLTTDRAGMAHAIEAAGGRMVLTGIAMRPGGTVMLGVIGDMVLVLIPEEPIAALTAMAVLGWPVLRRRAGIQHSRANARVGIAAFSLAAERDHALYPLLRVTGTDTMPTLETLTEASGDQTGTLPRLSRADGIALLTPGEDVGFGSRIAWIPINDRFG